jgi:hypothetical protein
MINPTGDLSIYYNSLVGDDFILCGCSQWDTSDNTIVISTWMNKSNITTLRDNIVPGAVGELYQILGKPTYYDKTWEGHNTLYIVPNPSSSSYLKYKFSPTVIYVKNITVQTLPNVRDYLECKIEGFISGVSI